MECAIKWGDTNLHTKWWGDVVIYTHLLETGRPKWPWFSRCSCVCWCKNSLLKADYWKELLGPFFYHVGRLCSWLWVLTHLKKTIMWPPWSRAGFILHTLGRLGMMGMVDNSTFSLTLVDLKSQSFSSLLQVWKFAQTFLKFALNLVVERDRHWYFFSYSYWSAGTGVFQVEMDCLGFKLIFCIDEQTVIVG